MRAWASSRESSLVDGEQTSRDLGLDKVLLPKSEECQRCTPGLTPPPRSGSPVLSRMTALCLGLNRASVLLSMNSTTTDWMRTSMNAAVPLKQADSICLDLERSQRTSQPI